MQNFMINLLNKLTESKIRPANAKNDQRKFKPDLREIGK